VAFLRVVGGHGDHPLLAVCQSFGVSRLIFYFIHLIYGGTPFRFFFLGYTFLGCNHEIKRACSLKQIRK